MEDGTIVLVGATTENPVVRADRADAVACARAGVQVARRGGGREAARPGRDDRGAALPLDAQAPVPRWRAWPTGTAAPRSRSSRRCGAPRARTRYSTPPSWQQVVQRRAPIYDKQPGRPLQPDQRTAQVGARLRSRRGALLSLPYARRRRGSALLARRVVRMAIEDIGLADPQALVICNAAKEAYDFLGSPEGELAIAEAVIYRRHRAEVERGLPRLWCGDAHRQGSGLAAAAQAHPQCADQADALGRLWRRLRLRPRRARGFLRTGLFPGAARPSDSSTIRPSAASSARSESASITGPSCGRSGAAREDGRSALAIGAVLACRLESQRGFRWALGLRRKALRGREQRAPRRDARCRCAGGTRLARSAPAIVCVRPGISERAAGRRDRRQRADQATDARRAAAARLGGSAGRGAATVSIAAAEFPQRNWDMI